MLRKEREELKVQQEYNPFGRQGAGAPMRDIQGNIIVNRKQGAAEMQQQVQFQQQRNQAALGMGELPYHSGSTPQLPLQQQQYDSLPPMMMDPYSAAPIMNLKSN